MPVKTVEGLGGRQRFCSPKMASVWSEVLPAKASNDLRGVPRVWSSAVPKKVSRAYACATLVLR